VVNKKAKQLTALITISPTLLVKINNKERCMKFGGQTELQSVEFFKREYGEYTTNDAVN
jgi:hypothetical protein